MISHKPLGSVSHNFGHSFISLMNYINDDYLLGHLLRQARKTNMNKLTVDILEGKSEPNQLLTNAIKTSIKHYCDWFPTLVNESGSTIDYVASATMTIEFDLKITRPYPKDSRYNENPFCCEILIIDDRGKEYRHTHSGWWFPETDA
jgi:hypothetical protein